MNALPASAGGLLLAAGLGWALVGRVALGPWALFLLGEMLLAVYAAGQSDILLLAGLALAIPAFAAWKARPQQQPPGGSEPAG